MATDWYDTAKKEFLLDLWTFTGTTPEAAFRVYSFLCDEGLIDYDIEKDYLFDNYVEDEDTDED